jgi:hypothetical protein
MIKVVTDPSIIVLIQGERIGDVHNPHTFYNPSPPPVLLAIGIPDNPIQIIAEMGTLLTV